MYVKQAHCVSNDLDAVLRNRNLDAELFSSFDDFLIMMLFVWMQPLSGR